MDRRIKSLPIINISEEVQPIVTIKRKSTHKRNKDNVMILLSILYAKILIIIGISLSVTDAIATDVTKRSFKIYNFFLYVGSVLFLSYIYIINNKEHPPQRDSGVQMNSPERFKRSGSILYRVGVVAFGLCSIIHGSLKFGQYFERRPACSQPMEAVIPASRIVFVLSQILFIFSDNNFSALQKRKSLSKFGLMHLMATNVCEWLSNIVKEAQYDVHKSITKTFAMNETLSEINMKFVNSKLFRSSLVFFQNREKCYDSNIIRPIYIKTAAYLVSFTIEHHILCVVVLIFIWRNCCGDEKRGVAAPPSTASARTDYATSRFSVDCTGTRRGLSVGLLALTVALVGLILFFEMNGRQETRAAAVLQVDIWEAALFWTGTMAVVFCLIALRDVNFTKMKRGLELEHLLILVAQFGVYMYFIFQIIGAALTVPRVEERGAFMRLLAPISGLLETSCQTVLILDASRRRCSTPEEIKRRPGRQFVTFLLVTNTSLWIVNRLKDNRSASHPFHMDFYGILAWNVITHVTVPLVVNYRFQSTICFYEIWKHVYKARHPARKVILPTHI